jgi:probable F420-dependent oxidoreductase
MPRSFASRYPYAESGELPLPGRAGRHEQLTTIAYLAAKTTRLRFMTAVMVVPHRPALLTAKILATIDILSAGRLTVACGAGWLSEEFEAVGAPPFAERGAVVDEYLAAFRVLWTLDTPRFDGRYVKFANIDFSPKPTTKSGPPLWIGGESDAAMRRAGRLGDGWYPIGTNPHHPLDTLARYRAAVDRVRTHAADAGRDPTQIKFGYYCAQHGESTDSAPPDKERKLFVGAPAEIASDLRAFRELGVEAVDFRLGGPTVDAAVARMREFCEQVLSRI